MSPKAKPEYVVLFSDGSKIECHGNHEWVVYNRTKHKWEKVETKQIYQEGKLYKGDGKRGSRYKYQVDANVCVKFNDRETGIDPYLFGAWLGDGCIKKGVFI